LKPLSVNVHRHELEYKAGLSRLRNVVSPRTTTAQEASGAARSPVVVPAAHARFSPYPGVPPLSRCVCSSKARKPSGPANPRFSVPGRP
jgi:hypothetical protein